MRQIVADMGPAPAPEAETPAVEAPKKAAPKKAVAPPEPTPEPEVEEPKRARDDDGHFVPDDPATPEVNEAWEGGKAPTEDEKLPTWDSEMTKKELLGVRDDLIELGKQVDEVTMKDSKKKILKALEDAV
jgi:hypothetical protein